MKCYLVSSSISVLFLDWLLVQLHGYYLSVKSSTRFWNDSRLFPAASAQSKQHSSSHFTCAVLLSAYLCPLSSSVYFLFTTFLLTSVETLIKFHLYLRVWCRVCAYCTVCCNFWLQNTATFITLTSQLLSFHLLFLLVLPYSIQLL
jgi:hypothetical protein